MVGKNPPNVRKERDVSREEGKGIYMGKLFFQILQLLHHMGIAKEQAEGNL